MLLFDADSYGSGSIGFKKPPTNEVSKTVTVESVSKIAQSATKENFVDLLERNNIEP